MSKNSKITEKKGTGPKGPSSSERPTQSAADCVRQLRPAYAVALARVFGEKRDESRFSGALPGTFRKKHVAQMDDNWRWSHKGDGERAFLFVDALGAVLLGRDMVPRPQLVSPWGDRLAGTDHVILLDVEIKDQKCYPFDIFLAPASRPEQASVFQLPYGKRLQVLATLMKHDTLGPVHQDGALELIEKPFYPIADLVSYMRSSKYPLINSDPQKRHTWEGLICDGFIFADMRANAMFDGARAPLRRSNELIAPDDTLLKYKALITYDVRVRQACAGRDNVVVGKVKGSGFRQDMIYMCKWVPSEGETVFEVIEPLPSKKDPNAPRTIRDMLEADSERMAPLVLSTLLAGGEPAKQLVSTWSASAQRSAHGGSKRKLDEKDSSFNDEPHPKRVKGQSDSSSRSGENEASGLRSGHGHGRPHESWVQVIQTLKGSNAFNTWKEDEKKQSELEIRLASPRPTSQQFEDMIKFVGSQPKRWQSAQLVVSFVDEIYNYADGSSLRKRTYTHSSRPEMLVKLAAMGEHIHKVPETTVHILVDQRYKIDVSLKRELVLSANEFEELVARRDFATLSYRSTRRMLYLDLQRRYQIHFSEVQTASSLRAIDEKTADLSYEVETEAFNRATCTENVLVEAALDIFGIREASPLWSLPASVSTTNRKR